MSDLTLREPMLPEPTLPEPRVFGRWIVWPALASLVLHAGFLAFLMSLCSLRFSATQYALLSSLMGASRDVLVAPAGGIAEATGWPMYFLITLFAAVPGLLLLPLFAPWNRDVPILAVTHPGATAGTTSQADS